MWMKTLIYLHSILFFRSTKSDKFFLFISRSPAAKKVIGTRVSVTNLHAVATADDIEELFENIGKVTSAKMAAKGSVVVVFKSTADAQKWVQYRIEK